MKKPIFCYIAFKGKEWGGVSAPEPKELLADFMADMAEDGYTLKPLYSRAEYESELAKFHFT